VRPRYERSRVEAECLGLRLTRLAGRSSVLDEMPDTDLESAWLNPTGTSSDRDLITGPDKFE
jgi:hypothetical protein